MLSPVSSNNRGIQNIQQSIQPVQKLQSNAQKNELESKLEKDNEIKTQLAASNNISNPSISNNQTKIETHKANSISKTQGVSESDSPASRPQRARFDTYEKSQQTPSAGVYEKTPDSSGQSKISFAPPEDIKDKVDLTSSPASKAEQTQTVNSEQSQTQQVNQQPELSNEKQNQPVVESEKSEAMLYNVASNEAEKNAPSNLSVNVDKSSELDKHSFLKIANDSRNKNQNTVSALNTTRISIPANDVQENTSNKLSFKSDAESKRIDMMKNELSNAAKQLNMENQTQNKQNLKSISETMLS